MLAAFIDESVVFCIVQGGRMKFVVEVEVGECG